MFMTSELVVDVFNESDFVIMYASFDFQISLQQRLHPEQLHLSQPAFRV